MSGRDRDAALKSAQQTSTAASNLRGVLSIIASGAFFVFGDALLKVVINQIPLGEVIAVRGLVSLLVMVVALSWRGLWPDVIGLVSRLVGWRVLLDIAATHTFFVGLAFMAFADAFAISQFTPLAVTAGAALFLGERVGWRRWLATGIGLCGVLLIVRPGTSTFDWAAIIVVISVLCGAVRDLVTRRIRYAIPTLVLAFGTVVAVMLSGFARMAIEGWVWLDARALMFLAASGTLNCGGYYFAVAALRSGEISVIAPFRYTTVLIAVAIGMFVFAERPDPSTLAGIAIVVGAGLYSLHRERIRARQERERLARDSSREGDGR